MSKGPSPAISIRISAAFILFVCGIFLYGQEEPSSNKAMESDLKEKIENIAEKTDASLDYSELTDDLRFYATHPLNLNTATYEQLQSLIFLNDLQIYHILAYRETYGNFITIFELQGVEGMDEPTIRKITPFVTVAPIPPKTKIPLKNAFKYGHHQVMARYQRLLQQQQGYIQPPDSVLWSKPNAWYLGSPEKIWFRYGFNYSRKIRWGMTAEKDAGEVFLKNNVNDSLQKLTGMNLRNGFDFYSAHISLQDIGHLKALTIGDYQLRFGQGITLWGGLAFGKSSDAAKIKRFAPGISPYTSSDENRFFRGAAATVTFNNIDITAFYSSNHIDASLGEIDTTGSRREEIILSLQESGLHRKPLELAKKDVAGLRVFGGNMNFRKKRLSIGITGFMTKSDKDLIPGSGLYQSVSFSGTENINTGADYSYIFNKVSIFGEVAMSRNGAVAMLHGFTASLHPQLFVSLLYRDYPNDYRNLFSNGFAETNNYNERGIYSGLQFVFLRNWSLTAYYDLFSHPWLRYRVDKPSMGNEMQFQVNHDPSASFAAYFRFRQQNKQINAPSEPAFTGTARIINYRKTQYRFHINYTVSNSIDMANAMEYLVFSRETGYRGTGFLIYHDVKWQSHNEKINLYFRYAIFDTDSYDERIYAYENDVLYAFSIPAYYYKGYKVIGLISFNLLQKLRIWLRISHLLLDNKKTIGSGLDLIDGNNKSEVKAELQLKL